MRISLVGLILVFGASAPLAQGSKQAPPIVILDAGHGGADIGASQIVNGLRVAENGYMYDVALRAEKIIKARGQTVVKTTHNGEEIDNRPANHIKPIEHKEVYALDGTPVHAGSKGLGKRTDYGNQVLSKYKGRRVVWISIHFDKVGTSADIKGVRIIVSDFSSKLAREMAKSFGDASRLREKDAIVPNGDKTHGIRHLFVLGRKNRVKEKVLVELGNFNNADDLFKIRDPNVRQLYAEAIANAVK